MVDIVKHTTFFCIVAILMIPQKLLIVRMKKGNKQDIMKVSLQV